MACEEPGVSCGSAERNNCYRNSQCRQFVQNLHEDGYYEYNYSSWY
jgi:hypothetical protein